MNRRLISNKEISESVSECIDKMYQTLDEKGFGSYASIHEIGGVMKEEWREFWDEIHGNDHDQIVEELKDIATVCMFGVACIKAGFVD